MCAYVVYEQNQLELNRKPIFWRMNFSLKNGIIKGNSVVKEWRDGYTSDAEHKQVQQVRLKPKNDFIFKRLFGESDVKEALLSLLNAIFQQERRQ